MASGDSVRIQMRFALTYLFINWHRRVDPVWAIEMISATAALGMVVWMMIGSRRPITDSAFSMIWFVGLAMLSGFQFYCALLGTRPSRAVGCAMALSIWSILIVIIGVRAGFQAIHAPLIAVDTGCLAAVLAYYVSPTSSVPKDG
jgi:hypothetical protein